MIALLLAAALELPSVNDVVRVIGGEGFAHACPLEGGRLATNKHVVRDMYQLRWSDSSGNEGTAERVRWSETADLALLRITRGKPVHAYKLAARPPKPGDRVVLRGYRYDGRKNVMAERRVETRVTRVEAGHVVYENSGFRGSSGSCVFNEQGEVIGINAWSVGSDVGNEAAGLAVGLWGEWAKELEVDTVD